MHIGDGWYLDTSQASPFWGILGTLTRGNANDPAMTPIPSKSAHVAHYELSDADHPLHEQWLKSAGLLTSDEMHDEARRIHFLDRKNW